MRIAGQNIRILVLFVTVLLLSASERPAFAAQYSAIVMDMRDGTVLYESNPDRRQSPASLTKMMTLYLAFEAVENGQLRLDQKVRVSRHAARQPPSKLYLKSGQRVSIRSLIRASAIKSANDAAVALAEAVSGSEKAFARLMTSRARQFGMTNTTFRNANGLTARGHLSTARDMAILGRHLFFDFPQYYNLFSRKTARAAGKRVYNTNRRLLSSYAGADGIKTGYTNAAGYTLVASARRGKKRVIASLFGGKSSRWRNARMVKLLDKGFARAATRVAVVKPGLRRMVVARAPLPPPKPGTPATGFERLAQVLASEAVAATPPSNSRMAPLYAVMPSARPALNTAQKPLPVPRPGRGVRLGALGNQAAGINKITQDNVKMLADAAPGIDEIRGREGMPL
jgi:D-alanyl-D-alanine carboxypeptidase